MVVANQIMSRLRKVQNQLLDIQRVEGAADKVGFKISDSMTFLSGDNTVGELVFNVPKYAAFRAHSLNLFAGYRQLNLQTPRQDDITFRPVDYLQAARFFTGFNDQDAVNLSFSIRDSKWGRGQDADCNVLTCFSGRVPTLALSGAGGSSTAFLDQTPVTGWLGGMQFKKYYRFDPGMSMTVKVSPKFSFDQQSAALRKEYRIFGVLDGHRLVWRK